MTSSDASPSGEGESRPRSQDPIEPGLLDVARDRREAVVSEVTLALAVERALELGGRPGIPLALVFVDDATLAELHAERLGDPSRTDVMAFDLGEGSPGPVGELYVSVDRAREVATQRGVSVERELILYVVHGVLHLCGFDDHDEEDREEMRAAERTVLDGMGFEADLAEHELTDDALS